MRAEHHIATTAHSEPDDEAPAGTARQPTPPPKTPKTSESDEDSRRENTPPHREPTPQHLEEDSEELPWFPVTPKTPPSDDDNGPLFSQSTPKRCAESVCAYDDDWRWKRGGGGVDDDTEGTCKNRTIIANDTDEDDTTNYRESEDDCDSDASTSIQLSQATTGRPTETRRQHPTLPVHSTDVSQTRSVYQESQSQRAQQGQQYAAQHQLYESQSQWRTKSQQSQSQLLDKLTPVVYRRSVNCAKCGSSLHTTYNCSLPNKCPDCLWGDLYADGSCTNSSCFRNIRNPY